MKQTWFSPWMCVRCGFMMDVVSAPGSDATPEEGDYCMCLNCGKIYFLSKNQWTPAGAAAIARLPADVRRKMQWIEAVRRKTVDRDLAAKDKHA